MTPKLKVSLTFFPISSRKTKSYANQNELKYGEHCVIIIGNETAKQLSIKSGDWLNVYIDNYVSSSRYATAIVNDVIKDNSALISDSLFFNIANGDFINFFDCKIQAENKLSNDIYPVAESVELSLIYYPQEWKASDIDSILIEYFTTPKYLTKNDVFQIDSSTYNKKLFNSAWDVEINVAWFRVENLKHLSNEKDGMFVSTTTKLLMVSSNKKKSLPLMENLMPDLFDSILELQKVTNAFLHDSYRNISAKDYGLLIRGGAGRNELWKSIALSLGMNTYRFNCQELQIVASAGQPELKIRNAIYKTCGRSPCVLLLDNLEALGWENDRNQSEDLRSEAVLSHHMHQLYNSNSIIVGLSDMNKELAPGIARMFLPAINLPERPLYNTCRSMKYLLARLGHYQTNIPEDLPPGNPKELNNLATNVFRSTLKDESQSEINDIHWQAALDEIKKDASLGLGLARVPNVSWQDIGGLEDVREDVLRTVQLPLKHPELRASGLKRSGIILCGPAGTGKTLVAKAVATECGLSFLSVKGPELLSMYVGESESNVRDLFKRARAAAPSVIFFDELDALAPARGRGGDGGGNVTDRVVSQLMAEMDGLTASPKVIEDPPVFVMAATNRPDLVEPALLRPGRFDKLLYVGPCKDRNAKLGVIKALTRKFHLSSDVILEDVTNFLQADLAFTGADLYSACSNAWRLALRERVHAAERGERSNGPVEVSMKHFQQSFQVLKPSISTKELAVKWQKQTYINTKREIS